MNEKIIFKNLKNEVTETLEFNCPFLYYSSNDLDEIIDFSLAVKIFHKKESSEPFIGFYILAPYKENVICFGLKGNKSDDLSRDFQILNSWWKRVLNFKLTGKDIKKEILYVSPSNGQF